MPGTLGDPSSLDAKRQIILRYARAAFISEGYAGARIEPIAREAGVSTATLYALFAGKSELFTAVIDDAADQFSRQMASVRAQEGDARTQLTSFSEAYAGFMGDGFVRSVFRLVMAERPRFEATARRFFEKGRTEFGATLIGILKDHLARGGLKDVEKPSWAAGELMGMIEHPVFFVPLVTGDEVRAGRTNAQVVAHVVDTFMARYGA
ncbi:TetR/AcrR family transcriptional regulator C-terminal domain-containing protein [Brevundimonas sp. GCM10030266]|uniref:TetR/AcrR family transcriptional regulator C-terminal domain-containing protein n=1 Tax=Brevundimonas sp. GCM10030266 TaxID=3273386 RepID=UPI0036154AD2